jgi:hypothetical protein
VNNHYLFNRTELLEWATLRRITVSPDIFTEPESASSPVPGLVDALTSGGVYFRVSGKDKESALRSVVDVIRLALKKTNDVVPSPKIVIAIGACAIGGGLYAEQAEVQNGADTVVPVDLYIPGCPPHLSTILHGLLQLLGRL